MILIANGRLYTVFDAIWYSFVLILRNSDYHRNKVNKDVKSWSYTQAEFYYFSIHWNSRSFFLREYFIERYLWIIGHNLWPMIGQKKKSFDKRKMMMKFRWSPVLCKRTSWRENTMSFWNILHLFNWSWMKCIWNYNGPFHPHLILNYRLYII